MSFHVPRSGRLTDHPRLGSSDTDGNNGAFDLESPAPGWRLTLICSDGWEVPPGERWEHVSVHAYRRVGYGRLQQRTPTWSEMHFVKTLCWDDEDVVMQLHPRTVTYVNLHQHTLHLWRPINGQEIPVPPVSYV